MKVIENKVFNSKYNLVFIHGWGGNEKSLLCLADCFKEKYSIYLVCLSGFDSDLNKVYTKHLRVRIMRPCRSRSWDSGRPCS